MSNSLALLEQADHMLAEANTIQKIKELRSAALTAKDWAKRMQKGEDMIQKCEELVRRANLQLGALLAATPRNHGEKGEFAGSAPSNSDGSPGKALHKKDNSSPSTPTPPGDEAPLTYEEMGLRKNDAQDAQLLARQPKDIQEKYVKGEITKATIKRAEKEDRMGSVQSNSGKAKKATSKRLKPIIQRLVDALEAMDVAMVTLVPQKHVMAELTIAIKELKQFN